MKTFDKYSLSALDLPNILSPINYIDNFIMNDIKIHILLDLNIVICVKYSSLWTTTDQHGRPVKSGHYTTSASCRWNIWITPNDIRKPSYTTIITLWNHNESLLLEQNQSFDDTPLHTLLVMGIIAPHLACGADVWVVLVLSDVWVVLVLYVAYHFSSLSRSNQDM